MLNQRAVGASSQPLFLHTARDMDCPTELADLRNPTRTVHKLRKFQATARTYAEETEQGKLLLRSYPILVIVRIRQTCQVL